MSPETAGGVTGEIGRVSGGETWGAGPCGGGVVGLGALGEGAGGAGFTAGLAQAARSARRTSGRWRMLIVGSLSGAAGRLSRNPTPKVSRGATLTQAGPFRISARSLRNPRTP